MTFAITSHKGFRLTLGNGVTVSVQFGPSNYCDHHLSSDYNAPENAEDGWESETAEVAAWYEPDGEWLRVDGFHEHDDVVGYLTVDRVVEFINACAARPAAVVKELPSSDQYPILPGQKEFNFEDIA